MIKSLRRRIVAINVVTAGLILLIAIVMIFVIGYSRINDERKNRLQFALSYESKTADIPFGENQLFDDIALVHYNLRTKHVEAWYLGRNFSIELNYLEDQLDRIAKNDGTEGFFYTIRYAKVMEGDTMKVAFNNFAERDTGLTTFFATTFFSILVGLAGYFIISFLLAKIALRPVEESWTKQKQFVADASHELKTPISVIMANTDMLVDHKEETVESQMQWIENTQSEAKRMADLVADLLFLAKNDDGAQVAMEETDLSEVVSSTVLGYDAIFYENKKNFFYDIQQGIKLEGNGGQLKQVVTILLDNANKYSTGDGNIHLKLSSNGKHASLTVSNNSEQLTSEQLQHLFDRFYTVDPSRNKNNGGNGLGLSIAKMICQSHGGDISVHCENGVITFTVSLPMQRKNRK